MKILSTQLKIKSCLPMATKCLVSYKVQSPMHQMLSVFYSQVVSPVENSTFIKTYKDIIHVEILPRKLNNEHKLHEGKVIPTRCAKCYTHQPMTLTPSLKVLSHWIFGIRWNQRCVPRIQWHCILSSRIASMRLLSFHEALFSCFLQHLILNNYLS